MAKCFIDGCQAKASYKETRYLGEQFHEHRSIASSVLKKQRCDHGHLFIQRKDWPLDGSLEPTISYNDDFVVWHNAIKTKPGIPPGKTTISEYSDYIHRGDHIQTLKRYRIAFFGSEAVAV